VCPSGAGSRKGLTRSREGAKDANEKSVKRCVGDGLERDGSSFRFTASRERLRFWGAASGVGLAYGGPSPVLQRIAYRVAVARTSTFLGRHVKALTTHTLRKLKGDRPIVAVTAYDALIARLADDAGVDVILVGDSVGNALLGFENTVPVTLEMMVHHTAAVVRAKTKALVVADLPFGEAHFDYERVLAGCQRLLQEAGATAVKIEATAALAPSIARLVAAGIPVWGHVGLQPQQINTLGRYRRFGTDPVEGQQLRNDARTLVDAGCFALLLEMVDETVAGEITAAVDVPTIGIGAGARVDGQILVYTDLLGLTAGYVPSFARSFAQVGEAMKRGFSAYAEAVKARTFP